MSEILSYYNASRGNMHCVLHDATKTLERVNYCMLFRKPLDEDMSLLIIRLVLYMWTSPSLQVRWGNYNSAMFRAKMEFNRVVFCLPIYILFI